MFGKITGFFTGRRGKDLEFTDKDNNLKIKVEGKSNSKFQGKAEIKEIDKKIIHTGIFSKNGDFDGEWTTTYQNGDICKKSSTKEILITLTKT